MPALDATPPLSFDDVVSMALPSGKRILALGCGDGELGAALLAAGATEVVGLDPCARGLTRARLTAVYRVDPEGSPELPYPDGYFDLLLVEDLSALVAPGPTLAHLRRWLAGSGALVAVVPNGTHETALVALLSSGRWPAAAGLRPLSFEGALEALEAGGFKPQDDMIAIRTEAGPAADVLRQLAEALGAPPARIGDSLTLVRSIIAARAVEPGPARAEPLADPWAGSRQVKVLLAPELDGAGDTWLEAVAGLATALSGNKGVTLGIALPLPVLEAPPAALTAAVGEADVDLLLTEAPADQAGWQRLLAGASTWVATSQAPALRPLAALVGVDVQLAG